MRVLAPISPDKEAGFSLFEVTIALFLAALLLTLVAQSGVRMFDRWNTSITERDIRNQISALPAHAHAYRQTFTLTDALTEKISVPNDWQVTPIDQIIFAESGICSGGDIEIHSPKGRTWSYKLTAPHCIVR